MKTYIISIFFFVCATNNYAQTTAIPDPKFEQILIDLGIDSDGTINGQVLTADVANVTVLDIPNNSKVDNLIGIEDFSALKILDVSNAGFAGFFNGIYPCILDLSQVHSLEEFYMNGSYDDTRVMVNYVDLSNNPNLKKIEIRDNWMIERINLQGSDLNIANLDLDLSGSISFSGHDICVQVTDANAAQNGQGVYANWTLCCNNYAFSEDCNLGSEDFATNSIQLYPNPATDVFLINSQQNIKKINIYDLHGKMIKNYARPQESYSVAKMEKGIYLVEIETFDDERQFVKLVRK